MKFAPDDEGATTEAVNKTEASVDDSAAAPILDLSKDSIGRGTMTLIAKETHDLSDDIEKYADEDVKSFKIIRPSGEIHFEAVGGLPNWNVFKLPLRADPYIVEITTVDGDVYSREI